MHTLLSILKEKWGSRLGQRYLAKAIFSLLLPFPLLDWLPPHYLQIL